MSGEVTVRRALARTGLVPLDAQVLLAHVLAKERSWLVAHADDPLAAGDAAAFDALAQRRLRGEPVAYLTGVREFWGLPLAVSPAVLIPRPETETLVEVALARLPAERDVRVLDLGTGSGAIALAIAHERPRARVLATDMSMDALAIARGNARRLGIGNAEFAQADWYANLPAAWRHLRFDLIASNPPYVAADDPHLDEGDVRFGRVPRFRPAATAWRRSGRSSVVRANTSLPAGRSPSSTATIRRIAYAECSRRPALSRSPPFAILPAFRGSPRGASPPEGGPQERARHCGSGFSRTRCRRKSTA